MDSIADFADLLALFGRQRVRYLIIGGLAFVYHAKPRYTKDLDLSVNQSPESVKRANTALAAFGSPILLDAAAPDDVVQIGLAPNRSARLRRTGIAFGPARDRRVEGHYGDVLANWIDLDGLIAIKCQLDDPRHRADVRVREQVKRLRQRPPRTKPAARRPRR